MEDRYRLHISPRAAKDLTSIFDRVAAESEAAAPAVVGRILRDVESLKFFPKRNVVKASAKAGAAVHSLPVAPYIVYFRVKRSHHDGAGRLRQARCEAAAEAIRLTGRNGWPESVGFTPCDASQIGVAVTPLQHGP